MKSIIIIMAALVMTLAAPAAAQTDAASPMSIESPWLRETAAGQSAGGGFLVIANGGASDDRLTGGSTAVAAQVQVHEMRLTDGVMRMRPLKGGLAIPAGKSVTLKPGSFHIMLVGLKRPLKRGETIPVTLDFARVGKMTVAFPVQPVTYGTRQP
jgi:copper(I)-binding protein